MVWAGAGAYVVEWRVLRASIALSEEQILGLEVAMGDALAVTMGKGSQDLAQDILRLVDGKLLCLKNRFERRARVRVEEGQPVRRCVEVDELQRQDVVVVQLLQATHRAK